MFLSFVNALHCHLLSVFLIFFPALLWPFPFLSPKKLRIGSVLLFLLSRAAIILYFPVSTSLNRWNKLSIINTFDGFYICSPLEIFGFFVFAFLAAYRHARFLCHQSSYDNIVFLKFFAFPLLLTLSWTVDASGLGIASSPTFSLFCLPFFLMLWISAIKDLICLLSYERLL